MTDSHPTDTQLAAFAAGGDIVDPGAISAHLDACAQCRTIVDRLGDGPVGPIPDVPLPESPVVPAAAIAAIAAARAVNVAPDQLWRAAPLAGEPIMLVWIRTVRPSGGIGVVPVSMDPDHADEYSFVLDADRSPLGVELVFHSTVETTIDPSTLVDCLATNTGVTADITAVRTARAEGQPVVGLRVGAPIVSLTDDRIEYRQQLADALLALTTARLVPDQSDDEDDHDLPIGLPSIGAIGALIDDEITSALLDELAGGLWDAHPWVRVIPASQAPGRPGDMAAFATIVNIDVFVSLLTVATDIPDDALPELSRSVFQTDLSIQAVCFVATPSPFHARLIDRRALSVAYETPTGRLRLPEDLISGDVNQVLLKFFDERVNPFRSLRGASVDPITINHRDLAVEHGASAVSGIAARASTFRVPGKSDGYSRVPSHREAVITIVEQALTSDNVDIEAILDGEE